MTEPMTQSRDTVIRLHGESLSRMLDEQPLPLRVRMLRSLDDEAMVALQRYEYDFPHEVDSTEPCVCGAEWVGRPAEGVLMGTRVMTHTEDCAYQRSNRLINEMYEGW